MTRAIELVRPDLIGFAGYASARRETFSGAIWLNANESPNASSVDGGLALNRYPEPQPAALRSRLAMLYAVREEQLMVTRGSDEGIDLLVRAFCRAGLDGVMIAPPCFGMYAVCARIQNAPLVEVALKDDAAGWIFDVPSMLKVMAKRDVRLVFLCSPANPTGQSLSLGQIRSLAQAIDGRAILVIDEAYAEFSDEQSASELLSEFSHLVVLRTLSKAHALAGARIGVVLADPDLVTLLRNLSAPYPVAAPSATLALAALADDALLQTRQRIKVTVSERNNLFSVLSKTAGVRRVYPSQGNYLLVRFDDVEVVYRRLLERGVVVRDMRAQPCLADALRISVGTPIENQALLAALQGSPIA